MSSCDDNQIFEGISKKRNGGGPAPSRDILGGLPANAVTWIKEHCIVDPEYACDDALKYYLDQNREMSIRKKSCGEENR